MEEWIQEKANEGEDEGFLPQEHDRLQSTEQSEHCDTLHRRAHGNGYGHGPDPGLVSSRICNAV
ncbi:hypothetical protein N7451_010433 [Penicillium sp. IBT 35674x]|nr:hypothetical protein N7451_010433 [Penicillium sp. IBT 35674x]